MITDVRRRGQERVVAGIELHDADHALEHVASRLGPLSAAAGTSNCMLIYHFGTRDELLREILAHARRRQVFSATIENA